MDEIMRRDVVIATERRIFNRLWNHAKRTGEFLETHTLPADWFDEYEMALNPEERWTNPKFGPEGNLMFRGWGLTLLRRTEEETADVA